MIFISGIHGVGKTFFCKMVYDQLGIKSYSASELISRKRNTAFDKNKLIPNIDENQQYLLSAVDELRKTEDNFILDGHFCLLNEKGTVTRIGIETFTLLCPEVILLLTEQPEIICERRKNRDNLIYSLAEVEAFQNEEIIYGTEVAHLIGAQLYISKGSSDIDYAINFLKSI